MNKEQKWMVVVVVVSILVFTTLGYLIGYLNTDKGCNNNPLVYGIQRMNEMNEDIFVCECISEISYSNSFEFDKSGMWQRYP